MVDQFSRRPAPSPLDTLDFDPWALEEALSAATPADRVAIVALLEEVGPFLSPARFARKVDPSFLTPPHIALLDRKLLELVTGRLPGGKTKLMVTMPPRHGKSELCSKYLPSWFLARYPDRRVILTSYEAEFAADWGRKSRDVLTEAAPWCGIEIRSDSKAAHRWNVAGRSGGMVTAGVRGPVTGKGAHLFLIDDPVKNSEEAQSETLRAKAWDWYISTAKTRLEPGACQLVIMTRWHEDDLAGKLLAVEGDEWEVVNFPALAEEADVLGRQPGDALWPGAYDVAALEAIRDTPETGYWWSALYQQHPTTEDGGMFARSDFRHWRYTNDGGAFELDGIVVPVKDTVRFQTVDLAASKRTKADWTVVATWAITKTEPAHLILLDRFRGRIEAPEHLPLIEELHDRWSAMKGVPDIRFVGVEKQTFGLSVLQEAARKGLFWLRPLETDTDKYSRAFPASQLVKNHVAWFPERASWLETWESELLGFPNSAHDDQVDCFSYAALEFGKRRRWAPRARDADPVSMQDRIMRQLREKKRSERRHPMLGSW